MWTLAFWRAAFERAVKTFCQTFAALLVADGTGILDSDWIPKLSIAGMAALVSVLTSVGSDAATGTGPSLTNAEVIPDTEAEAAFRATFDDEAETIGDSKSAATYHPRHDAGPDYRGEI